MPSRRFKQGETFANEELAKDEEKAVSMLKAGLSTSRTFGMDDFDRGVEKALEDHKELKNKSGTV